MEATEARVRVVAGAGSGKTRVLAHRFAYLVDDIGISPGNILCLTFTNKAAREMKRRIAGMVDGGSVNDFICTIHSDETDAVELARQAMQDFGIDRKKTTAERFLKSVAAYKGYDPEAYISRHLLPASSPQCPDAIVRYIRLQLKQYALDFDDLLYFTLYILDRFKDASDYWNDKLNYVMVDEVQDCSADDWKLLHAITRRHGNLFVVGDPDQAIYEWRGGNPKIFIDFKADTDIILNENYRSTPDILDVANFIIDHNVNRVKKELFTRRLNERLPVYHHFKTEKEEADNIAEVIEEGVTREKMKYDDFAVLYRSSFLSRNVEQALLRHRIPYTVWGGVRFFERREIKDVVSYLRLIASDADDMAFRRIINLPARKFGASTLKKLSDIAEEEGDHLLPVLRRHAGERPFNRQQTAAFLRLIDEARQWAKTMTVSDLTDRVLTATGLGDIYRTDEQEERLENIAELIGAMKEFEATRLDDDDMRLPAYLQEIALYTNVDRDADADRVRLMTIHQAKGLEFNTVFIVGLTEGIFPNHRSIRERRNDGEEEERRLMYVAVTRACSRLYLMESEGYLNDTGALKYPSRFLSEVPEPYLQVEGNPDPSLAAGTRQVVDMLNAELHDEAGDVMAPGTPVRHKVFGEGVVEGYDAAAKAYKVRFGDITRTLLPRVLMR